MKKLITIAILAIHSIIIPQTIRIQVAPDKVFTSSDTTIYMTDDHTKEFIGLYWPNENIALCNNQLYVAVQGYTIRSGEYYMGLIMPGFGPLQTDLETFQVNPDTFDHISTIDIDDKGIVLHGCPINYDFEIVQ